MPPSPDKWKWIQDIPGAVITPAIKAGSTNGQAGAGGTVTLPGAPGRPSSAPAKGRNLTDKDFPTDIKERKRADEDARQKAKQRANEKPPDKDKSKGPPKDPAEEEIEEALGDPQKRLEEMAKWKVPRYSEAYKNDTPDTQFLSDLESGTRKAQEYFEYIRKASEYAEKYGDLTGLEKVSKAAAGLKKITGKLSGGLGKAIKVVNRAKQVAQWIHAVDKFADVSAAMDPKDRNSVKRWVSAMEDLWDATAPFAEWLQDKAATAAIAEGSEAGAALSATMAIVGAQLYIGVKLLDAGIKAESAYFDRLEKTMREIDRQSGNAPPESQREPLPPLPDEWVSREEAAQNAAEHGKEWEDAELKSKIRGAERAKREAHDEKVYEATKEFDEKHFAKAYMAHRTELRAKILLALRKAGSKTQKLDGIENKPQNIDGRSPESRWWDCLTEDLDTPTPKGGDGDSLTDSPYFDQKAGIYVYPTKAKVSVQEAEDELSAFAKVSPPCPFVKEIHDTELKKYLAKTVPPR